MGNEVNITTPEVRITDYETKVPFYRAVTIVEHTLTSNDEFTPEKGVGMPKFTPKIGYGAWYRLTADGTHTPTFTGFKKHIASKDYVSTLNTVNIVVFIYDGIDFWYSIGQAAEE